MRDGKRERERKREERTRGFPPPPFACTCGGKEEEAPLPYGRRHAWGEEEKEALPMHIDVCGERRKKKREERERERDSDREREPLLIRRYSPLREREIREEKEKEGREGKKGGGEMRRGLLLLVPLVVTEIAKEKCLSPEREKKRENDSLSSLLFFSLFSFSIILFLISLLYLYNKKIFSMILIS